MARLYREQVPFYICRSGANTLFRVVSNGQRCKVLDNGRDEKNVTLYRVLQNFYASHVSLSRVTLHTWYNVM